MLNYVSTFGLSDESLKEIMEMEVENGKEYGDWRDHLPKSVQLMWYAIGYEARETAYVIAYNNWLKV